MLHHIKKQNKTRGTNLKNTKIRKKKKKNPIFPIGRCGGHRNNKSNMPATIIEALPPKCFKAAPPPPQARMGRTNHRPVSRDAGRSAI
jgi:hypothetical protein